jgi:hypothetical protein
MSKCCSKSILYLHKLRIKNQNVLLETGGIKMQECKNAISHSLNAIYLIRECGNTVYLARVPWILHTRGAQKSRVAKHHKNEIQNPQIFQQTISLFPEHSTLGNTY